MPHLESKTKLIITACFLSQLTLRTNDYFTINGKNLAQSKIIHYLCSRILRWREYVLRKAFRKGSFLGRFLTY